MATLEIVLAEKNCLGEEVYLALKNVFKNPARALLYQTLFHKAVQNTHGEKNEAVALPTLSLHKFNELYQILN